MQRLASYHGCRAEVAELADAPDSKSGSLRGVWVRFPPSAFVEFDRLRGAAPVAVFAVRRALRRAVVAGLRRSRRPGMRRAPLQRSVSRQRAAGAICAL